MPLMNGASQSYVEPHGLPRRLEDLATHQLVHDTVLGTRSIRFEVLAADGGVTRIAMAGAVTVNNSESYLVACVAGLGMVQIPMVTAQELIDQGVPVDLLPPHRAPAMPVSAPFPG